MVVGSVLVGITECQSSTVRQRCVTTYFVASSFELELAGASLELRDAPLT